MRQIILALTIFCCLSCSKQDSLFIIGGPYIAQYSNGNIIGYINLEIQSDPILNTVVVQVNNDTIELIEGTPGISHTLVFETNTRPIIGDEYHLFVDSDLGNASAMCHIPTAFDLIQPLNIVQPDTDINIIWSQPYGADWYIAYLWYTYLDSSGLFVDIDTTIYCKDTTVIAPAQWFTKNYNISAMRIEITACNGPSAESGSEGNIKGAQGYWIGMHKEVNILGGQDLVNHQNKPPHDDLKRYLLNR